MSILPIIKIYKTNLGFLRRIRLSAIQESQAKRLSIKTFKAWDQFKTKNKEKQRLAAKVKGDGSRVVAAKSTT